MAKYLAEHPKRDKYRKSWNELDLREAMEAVRENKSSCNKAAKDRGIPRSTLHEYVKRNLTSTVKEGRPAVFSKSMEDEL